VRWLPGAWLLLAACRPGPFDDQEKALKAWKQGRSLLDEGRAAEAVEVFTRARTFDPDAPSLVGWQARALAAAGDPAGALREVDAWLATHPGDPTLVYNRACYRARTGDLRGAHDDLAIILPGRDTLIAQARSDPDLADVDLTGIVEERAPHVTVTGEQGSVLLGDLWDLSLEIGLERELPLSVTYEGDEPGIFVPVRVVDERTSGDAGVVRTLSFSLLAVGGGEGQMGPWKVQVGASRPITTGASAVRWKVVAPSGMAAPSAMPDLLAAAFPLPREVLADRETPSAATWGDRLLVVHAAGDRVEVTEAATLEPALRMEIREGDQIRRLAVAWRWAPDARGAQVKISRAGAPVLDTQVVR